VSNQDNQNVASNLGVTPTRSYFFSTQSAELAPIALFVYNRPEHTRRTVESLRANGLSQRSDLFVFADAAKNKSEAAAVEMVRKFIRTIDGFKSVTIIERERNFGLNASVITGVTQLCEKLDRVIAVEDDLLTAPDFLTFMNCALERYAQEPRIFSVSGFNYAVNTPGDYPYDVFCSHRSSSWGWGTWKDRWEKADWSASDFGEFRTDKVREQPFNRGGEDLSDMLALQMAGKLDSWDIRWAYAHFTHNAAALLPVASRVYNIGLDGSGVHCRRVPYRQAPLTNTTDSGYRFPNFVEFDPYFAAEIRRVHRRTLAERIVRYLRRITRTMTVFDSNRIPLRAAKRSAADETAVPAWHRESGQQFAPIALFVYNRPEHTRKTVESLQQNGLARKSDLFVFSDAAKNESGAAAVGAVRKFIRTIDGFKSVTVIERERNLGLAGSVIKGVTQLSNTFGRVIVMEDDLLTSSDFLTFMNWALEQYADEPRIFSVSGFNYAVKTPDDYPYDVFCSYRSSSWGWGTWKDRWEKADWSVSDFGEFRTDKVRKQSFNRGGEDLSRMLALQMAGEIDSWAIRWAYAHWKHDALAVLPVRSLVLNIGLDGSGMHCRKDSARQTPLNPVSVGEIRMPLKIDPGEPFTGQIYRMHRASLLVKCARFVFRSIRNRKRRRGTLVEQMQIQAPPADHTSGLSR